MKNQYFGDINDYKKYGLLRSIIEATGFQMLVAWMLTSNDGGPDGRFTEYLQRPDKYRIHDPLLFDGLQQLLNRDEGRYVGLIESTDLLPQADYFSEVTPDFAPHRTRWFDALLNSIGNGDMVFLDPDNGLEIKSKPYGSKYSSKYIYWREVERIWSEGKSLLVYQHFIREKRQKFVQRMLTALEQATPESFVEAFSTADVLFLMALQPDHHRFHRPICETVQARWGTRIRHWDLVKTSGATEL